MSKFLILMIVFSAFWLTGCGSSPKDSNTTASADSAASFSKKPAGKGKRGGFDGRGSRLGPGGPAAPSAAPVEVTFVSRGDISNFLIFNASLETEQTVQIYSRISGDVEKLFVEEGYRVRKNQPLLQLEQVEYILEEQKAKVTYDQKKAEFERSKALLKKNLISEEEFETARLNFRQAELGWKQAQLNLANTTIRSPIKGVVGERTVNVGDRIQPTTKLFVVSNLDEKVVKVFVPQDEMPRLKPRQLAEIHSDVLPNRHFRGWIKRISPIIDPESGTFKVTVGVKDPENNLRVGMYVSVNLIVDTHRNTLLIPKASLIYESDRTYFFTLQRRKAVRMELQKGYEDAEKVEVLNPLKPGTPVVVLGQNGLKDGSPVKIIERRRYTWQKSVSRHPGGSGARMNASN